MRVKTLFKWMVGIFLVWPWPAAWITLRFDVSLLWTAILGTTIGLLPWIVLDQYLRRHGGVRFDSRR